MRRLVLLIFVMAVSVPLCAQADRHDVRKGNRHFRKGDFREAEIDYRKAVLKDSLSLKAAYNLASALYREEDYESASKSLDAVSEQGAGSSDYHFNAGDVSLAVEDYAAAVESFKQSLLLNPSDLEAKENYIYARKMLENSMDKNQDQNGGQNSEDNKEERNNQDNQNSQGGQNGQDDQNDQNDQDGQGNQDDNKDGGSEGSASGSGISKRQAAQMLRAIQAKEAETQEKVGREKALLLKSNQKEKNW